MYEFIVSEALLSRHGNEQSSQEKETDYNDSLSVLEPNSENTLLTDDFQLSIGEDDHYEAVSNFISLFHLMNTLLKIDTNHNDVFLSILLRLIIFQTVFLKNGILMKTHSRVSIS